MGTPYAVAIDLRDESTSVAIAERLPDGALAVRPVLEGSDGGIPTTVFLGDDDVVFGEAALELGLAEPDRLIDGFVSRVAEAGAFFEVHGERVTPPQLVAWVVDDVVHRVTGLMGEAPASIGVLVPDAWSDARLAAVEEELRADGHRAEFLDRLDSTALAFARSAPYFGSRMIVSSVADDTSVESAVLRIGGDGVVNRLADPVTIELDAGLDHRQDAADVRQAILDALAAAGRALEDMHAVIVSGEPAVVEPIAPTIASQLGRPLEALADVGAFAAVGAAWDLSAELAPVAPLTAVLPSAGATAASAGSASPAVSTTAISSPTDPAAGSRPARSRRWIAVSAAVVAMVAVVGGASALALGVGGTPEVDQEVPAVVAPTRSPSEREVPASPTPGPTSPASVTPVPSPTSEIVVDGPTEASDRRTSARPTPTRSTPVASTPPRATSPTPTSPSATSPATTPSPSVTASPPVTPSPEPSESSPTPDPPPASPTPSPSEPEEPGEPGVPGEPGEPGEPENPTEPFVPDPGNEVPPGTTP
ncbi:hypothetical protein QSU92_10150 [Microbacterium sp. ET2]|uniref:hypothetical protein n=1 Tax=Microbacterium albipurpureum TaxID=3050384 RepID=UPI00259D2DE4|nr:hypothetical protein [Microbacterium sp. ET2 (Ac-2212)]WJL94352.1 hypothetical protein QSU92_10150 [Microbacterium sp. ET2 (Ac-2212)]